MKSVVWIQLNDETTFHAVSTSVYQSADEYFTTLCGLVSWTWQDDDVEGDVEPKCVECLAEL